MTVIVKNLTKKYGEKTVLDNLSFEVKKGEILGIIGRSGAGKSTLINILRGSEKSYDGEVEIFGKTGNFRGITAIHLQRNFALWAEPAIYNIIRKIYAVRNNSDESLPMEYEWEEYEKTALEILKLVGLEHKKNAFSNILSGGEKQRLILGRQIAKMYETGEGVLLLDEPATMSCPASKQALLDVLKNINEKLNITIIITSHLPEIHKYLCHRCILIEDGKIKMEGAPEEVVNEFLKDLKEPYFRKTTPSDNSIIEVKDVSKRYFVVRGGETLNMKNVSFDVKEKEILSIIGPSGTGKSVLLRLLAGVELPDSGAVKIEGIDLSDYGWERINLRRKIGVMHQEFSLTPYLTLEEILKYRLGIKGEKALANAKLKSKELGLSPKVVDGLYQLIDLPEPEMKNKLEKLGVSEDVIKYLFPAVAEELNSKEILSALDLDESVLKKTPRELSGGEKVRAAIALQLVSKPKILLLDEPFGDLDPVTLRDVSNYLKKINDELGTTIVLISHHVELIKEISDRAVLIDEGKIIAQGAPEEVCELFIERSNSKFLNNKTIKNIK
ncbi:MAG: methyl coenzyme reductase system, component [Methanothermococcus sp.]|uniref:ATP-binding cassette domain-containing protein n=1 Tax=Methanothermococcus TaxID=155862 RepID=UPI000373D1B5|nr:MULTISPECIES: ATP-binding cassette domain-containing protein [Methanothermococcus]MDK2790979.1 methyl coenzyme reductase system, component [Methanothermococcus sp.]MDK2987148.1 methyl coenzyme reductase system, component [Methanothermococcus sp.]